VIKVLTHDSQGRDFHSPGGGVKSGIVMKASGRYLGK
jgi:hypothetical protein